MTSEAPQDVAALLRELAEKATPGPWTADCVPGWGDGPGPNLPDAVSGFEERVALNLITGDARYIAAASPDVVLGLLDQNDRLRSALQDALNDIETFETNRLHDPNGLRSYRAGRSVLRGSGAEEAARNE